MLSTAAGATLTSLPFDRDYCTWRSWEGGRRGRWWWWIRREWRWSRRVRVVVVVVVVVVGG